MYLVSKILVLIVPSLISVAFMTLLERKVLSLVGSRLGPNKVSFLGLLQPIGDALKLSNKQINSLSNFSVSFYYFSAVMMMFCSILLWMCIFSVPSAVSFKFSVILFMLILGLNSLNSILSGWSTFSKYSLIGSLRTVAQLISYESSLYFCLIFCVFIYSSFLASSYHFYFFSSLIFISPLCFMIWVPSFLAELNRTPYDFSEGESELVSGFNTEFGSKCFTLIFLAEYSNIVFFCFFTSFLFFMDFYLMFFFFFLFFCVWVRSVLPRYRFDKLMMLAWKILIPFITLIFILSYIFIF